MLRLTLLIVLFFLSLLCVFSAPEFHIWYLAIMVTEFPLVFIMCTCILLISGVRTKNYRLAGSIVGSAALILFFSPLIRSSVVASTLDQEFSSAFEIKEKAAGTAAFHIKQMIFGNNEKAAAHSTKTYSTIDGKSLTMDFYYGQKRGNKPCVIVIHGGSWQGGDSHQLPELNTHLANAGYNVISINYRLAPQYHSPAPVDDVRAVLAYIKQNAKELETDTSNFVLLGRSAGAQIALAAAYTLHEPGVKGVISFYGPADMIWGYKNPASPLIMNSCQVIKDYVGGTLEQLPLKYKECSPIEWITPNAIPTLMIAGVIDPLVAYQHNTRLCDSLEKYHVPHFLLTLPWATHGFDYTLNGPGGQLSTYTVDHFLNYVLSRR